MAEIDISTEKREVLVDGAAVTLGARAFDVLAHLHAHRDRVVSKAELLETVWGGLTVEEGNLTVQISALRKALGPKAIATVPGVGYKLAGAASPTPAPAGPSLPAKPSLAVLPFANLTGDPGSEYLVDGIVTDLIGSLSRISGIFVIAATSCFAFKGKVVTLEKIGTDLGVRYVLEGSIQKAGDMLRISTQLVETESSHTIWSAKFSGRTEEIFDLQDRITEDVTGALEPTLIFAEAGRARRKPTESMAAYDLCLQATTPILRMPKADTFREAIALLDRAIALDPDYTLAKAWKCRAYLMARGGRYIGMDEMWEVEPTARTLLADHRNDPVALSFAAIAYSYFTRDRQIVASAVRHARAMAPNSGLVLQPTGWVLSYAEAYEEAIDCFERAIRFDPLGHSTGYCRTGMGISLLLSGRTEEALVSLELGHADTPEFGSAIMPLMNAYHMLGRMEEAGSLARKLMRLVPSYTISGNLETQPYQTPSQRAFIETHSQGLGLPP